MLNEGSQPRGQRLGQALLAWVVERAGHEQRASIVVDAISVRAIGHRTDRMLESPVSSHMDKK